MKFSIKILLNLLYSINYITIIGLGQANVIWLYLSWNSHCVSQAPGGYPGGGYPGGGYPGGGYPGGGGYPVCSRFTQILSWNFFHFCIIFCLLFGCILSLMWKPLNHAIAYQYEWKPQSMPEWEHFRHGLVHD